MRFENILVGSFLGALTGGSLVAWWFFDNLKDAKEIAEHSSYFADAQQGCLNSALIFASILCAMTIFEMYSSKRESSKSPEATMK